MLPYERSFASHPMAEMWSDKNEKRPQEVTKASHQFAIFDCKYCKHSFDATPNRMRNSTFYCPYCSNKKLCGKIDCDTCFAKSYVTVGKISSFINNIILISLINHNKNYFFKLLQFCATASNSRMVIVLFASLSNDMGISAIFSERSKCFLKNLVYNSIIFSTILLF